MSSKNSSSAATTGGSDGLHGISATAVIATDLEIDVGTLSVDADNNRVGIGTTEPSTKLQVDGVVTSTGLAVDSGTLSVDSGNNRVGIGTASPGVQLDVHDTTTGSANTGGQIRLSANDGAPMGDSHRLGVVEFTGAEDGSGTQVVGARIEALTDAAWTNVENGCALYFYTTDGNASQTSVLKLDSNKKATFAGDAQVVGDIILDDGGSLKEAGGTAAITFDGSGHVTKIGQDSPSSADVLTYDGSKWVASAPTVGDITGVLAGDGLSGGGTSGGVNLELDLVSNGGLEIQSGEVSVAQGISQHDVAQFAASVADNDFLRIDGTAVEGLSAAEVAAAIEGSIDAVGTIASGTWQGTAIASAYIAGDAIDGSKIADDSINSEHYVDNSIDTAHIADDQVTLAKMAGLARGKIIVGDSSGNPVALALGSDTYVLSSDGSDVVWVASSGGGGSPDDGNLIIGLQSFS
tara:strand:- start:267 stop:1658 length:1392 start_codon:yes stop_codon:yes gene_type:complete